MKILVMGAGAVGSYFGARLQAAGEDVVLCARGQHLEAIRERGLDIASPRGDLKIPVTATAKPAECAPYDLIIFSVKGYDTDAAAELIQGCIKPGGAILTIQNGVENEARLAAIFGADAVMGGNARVGVEMVAPGKIVHFSTGHIDFGELDGRESDRALKIADAFRRAGILGQLSADLKTLRWDKLIWNGSLNTIATLTRRRVCELLDDPESMRLLRTLMTEIAAVGRAEGAKLGDDRVEAYIAHSQKNLRALKTSTQQDLEHGKPLEYDELSGAVVRAARRHRIDVPANETIYALLRLLDGASRSIS
ncbi:MAG: 2-dehydropantoate 2-reductase [Candidatus Binatus sp.]|uniref:ketopantoate reductase family protein n=1 Tax=Candidatus Binatus sp. TaxID=2811406 RepID=UPI0027278021|nr:2-dehydropantoate 2-reductase [Candidatus Binatus sp.]MDO8434951.1 2-dehydropantoate 2-reductase [Candidatus Binatus sp.]